MTFCELVGVIEICVLPLCAIPTTGIVARDRSAVHVENNSHGRVALSRTFQGYPAKPPGAFPILPILCLILLGILISCTQRVTWVGPHGFESRRQGELDLYVFPDERSQQGSRFRNEGVQVEVPWLQHF